MDVQSIKDWFKNLPPQNIGLALLAIIFIAFAGLKGLEIISNLTKDSSSPSAKTPDLTDVNINVKTKKGSQAVAEVNVEIISKGPTNSKITDNYGYVEIQIPSRKTVEVILSKPGYNNARYYINLETDPNTNKTLYIEPIQPQPPLNQLSMLVPSIPASNSSPSPKPPKKIFEERFEGDLVTTNDCDPKDSELTEGGRNGRGLKVTNNNKIWGCRSFQLPKIYEAGKTYQASVLCKADKEAKCQLFFGEPHKVDQEAFNNESKVILQGNGDWQKIITNPIKIRPDKRVVVQVYSIEVPGKSVIFDDILVEEVINQ